MGFFCVIKVKYGRFFRLKFYAGMAIYIRKGGCVMKPQTKANLSAIVTYLAMVTLGFIPAFSLLIAYLVYESQKPRIDVVSVQPGLAARSKKTGQTLTEKISFLFLVFSIAFLPCLLMMIVAFVTGR